MSNFEQIKDIEIVNMMESVGDVVRPTFLNLLEGISPHLQSVLLDKCTVLELNCLAAVSRSLREGSLTAMNKRLLDVYIVADSREIVIVDRFDSSRTIKVQFCNCGSKENLCCHWPKVQQLMYFCRHARIERVSFVDEFFYPTTNKFPNEVAMKFIHTTPMQLAMSEVFINEVVTQSGACSELVQFVCPRFLRLCIHDTSYDRFDSIIHSRGMQEAETIIVDFWSWSLGEIMTDEKILKLNASCITFCTGAYQMIGNNISSVGWTRSGVSSFIEQWLVGSREIDRVQSYLPTKRDDQVGLGPAIIAALGKLSEPPQIECSTTLDDDLKGQLQILDGKMIYEGLIGFGPSASVIRVTATDGRQLSIVVTQAWNIQADSPTDVSFIDIFHSN